MNREKPFAQKAWRSCFEKLFCEKTDLMYDFCVLKKPPSTAAFCRIR